MAQDIIKKEIIFRGRVVRGLGRAKKMGFPTANLDVSDIGIDFGVYLVQVELDEKTYFGLMPYGLRQTFGEGTTAEVHIKGFDSDIYGRELKVRVLKKIRDLKKFDNVDELKAQIIRDVEDNF